MVYHAPFNNVVDMVGNTPLIKLQQVSALTNCTILGKAEFMNPGGSVKDRAAKFILLDALERGLVKPGGVVVEGTAGNTGIGLSLLGNSLGLRTEIVIPSNQSQEKKDMLRLCGAILHEAKPAPYKDTEHNFVHVSQRLAEQLALSEPHGAVWANQFDNIANKRAHIETTGPEIWRDTEGGIDGFVCAVGSGGTLSGIADYLRSQHSNVAIGLADPMGAALYHYYKYGELQSEGSSISEGIGQGRITENLHDLSVDYTYQITDQEALPYIYDIMQYEGMCLGPSSAVNIAGAVRLAKDLGPNATIVTILCDSGARYVSKMANRTLFDEQNLPIPPWL